MSILRMTFCLLPLLTLVSCQDLGEGTDDGSGWAIFTLADSTLTVSDLRSLPLERVVLQARPLLRATDLTAYYWSEHAFTGTAHLDSLLHPLEYPGGHTTGIPFVVAVGGNPIYLGTFWYYYSSIADPGCPHIFLPRYPGGLYTIHPSTLQARDPRGDPRVFAALTQAGILQE